LPVLMSHDFPGNIRELENIIEYATVVCKNSLIRMENLPDYLQPSKKAGRISWGTLERGFLLETLKRNQWNRSATAKQLGIHTSTLWRKMKRLNIRAPRQGKPVGKRGD